MSETGVLSSDIPMAIRILAISKWERHMVKESIRGVMEKSMTESGTADSSMATASGEDSIMTPILESGATRKLRDTAYTYGKTEIDTKVSGNSVSSMAREPISLQMVTSIPASIKMESLRAADSTPGRMVRSMLASSGTDLSMARANGSQAREHKLTCMRVTTQMTRSMASDFSHGQAAIFIRVNTKMTSEMVMAR